MFHIEVKLPGKPRFKSRPSKKAKPYLFITWEEAYNIAYMLYGELMQKDKDRNMPGHRVRIVEET